jgi:hypothetical protein
MSLYRFTFKNYDENNRELKYIYEFIKKGRFIFETKNQYIKGGKKRYDISVKKYRL